MEEGDIDQWKEPLEEGKETLGQREEVLEGGRDTSSWRKRGKQKEKLAKVKHETPNSILTYVCKEEKKEAEYKTKPSKQL